MITERERELGTRFAYINILATLIVFIVLAFVIGPDETGYNEDFGALTGLVGFAPVSYTHLTLPTNSGV